MKTPPTVRVANRGDIPAMHVVRLAVRENRLISGAITEQHYRSAIEDTGRGWVAEEAGAVIAFAVGNKMTGNIWALFVHPDHEGKGVGRLLQAAMLQWLFAERVPRAWLTTGPGTRAQRFYEATGWTRAGTTPDGEIVYERYSPAV
jgi:GNAT superfamily N-acetyltransferase